MIIRTVVMVCALTYPELPSCPQILDSVFPSEKESETFVIFIVFPNHLTNSLSVVC